MEENEAALYEKPFAYVRANVYPYRMTVTQKCCRTRWWLHHNPRPTMRAALAGLARYIATPATAKHRLFVWLPREAVPDHALIVVARDDDYTLGVLQSRVHRLWALAQGTQLETRPRYTPTTTFETFPFPRPTEAQREAISARARRLVELRDGWISPLGLEPEELAQRTLTNLYNQSPTWLINAHDALDLAVVDAYGWAVAVSDDEIVERLLEINLARVPA